MYVPQGSELSVGRCAGSMALYILELEPDRGFYVSDAVNKHFGSIQLPGFVYNEQRKEDGHAGELSKVHAWLWRHNLLRSPRSNDIIIIFLFSILQKLLRIYQIYR